MDLRVREVTVGSIVIVAILVFIFGTMWLSGRRVSSGNSVRMQFANVSGLKRASPVRVSGVNVGKVESIDQASRTVVVRGPSGELREFHVGEEVERLSEVKQGDTVVVRFTEGLAMEMIAEH